MEERNNLEVCLANVSTLTLNEKELLYRTLEQQLRSEQASRFHVTFNQELIAGGRIRPAVSDLSVFNLED